MKRDDGSYSCDAWSKPEAPCTREPQVYGQTSLADIDQNSATCHGVAGHELETFSIERDEGRWSIVLQQQGTQAALLIINLGPTPIPASLSVMRFWRWGPAIEVHLSNIYLLPRAVSAPVISR